MPAGMLDLCTAILQPPGRRFRLTFGLGRRLKIGKLRIVEDREGSVSVPTWYPIQGLYSVRDWIGLGLLLGLRASLFSVLLYYLDLGGPNLCGDHFTYGFSHADGLGYAYRSQDCSKVR